MKRKTLNIALEVMHKLCRRFGFKVEIDFAWGDKTRNISKKLSKCSEEKHLTGWIIIDRLLFCSCCSLCRHHFDDRKWKRERSTSSQFFNLNTKTMWMKHLKRNPQINRIVENPSNKNSLAAVEIFSRCGNISLRDQLKAKAHSQSDYKQKAAK